MSMAWHVASRTSGANMDTSLRFADFAIIFATLLGPVLAVQAQKWIERGREAENRRMIIFRTLMATRMANLSAAHVEALNAIPIEFYGKKRTHKGVITAWKDYLDHLNHQGEATDLWGQKRYELFIELLWRLSVALKYDFTKLEIQREIYSPKGHATVEAENEAIRQGMSKIFRGEAAFPLDIKSFATDPALIEKQQQIQDLLMSWLKGEAKVRVDLSDKEGSGPGAA